MLQILRVQSLFGGKHCTEISKQNFQSQTIPNKHEKTTKFKGELSYR